MTIGSELRAARERHGLSLKALAKRTTIRVSVLRAIENDDFQHVPGSVIMRGFLKLYAREVELDPEDIGRRYTAACEWPVAEGAANAAALAAARGARRRGSRGLRLIGAAAVLVALVAAGCPAWLRSG